MLTAALRGQEHSPAPRAVQLEPCSDRRFNWGNSAKMCKGKHRWDKVSQEQKAEVTSHGNTGRQWVAGSTTSVAPPTQGVLLNFSRSWAKSFPFGEGHRGRKGDVLTCWYRVKEWKNTTVYYHGKKNNPTETWFQISNLAQMKTANTAPAGHTDCGKLQHLERETQLIPFQSSPHTHTTTSREKPNVNFTICLRRNVYESLSNSDPWARLPAANTLFSPLWIPAEPAGEKQGARSRDGGLLLPAKHQQPGPFASWTQPTAGLSQREYLTPGPQQVTEMWFYFV